MRPTDNDKYGVSSMAEATKWVSVVTTVVGVMTVPALGGMWMDNLLGTKYLFAILGVVFGFAGGMYCLLEMVKAKSGAHQSR
jgi:F0F1-type ATP synthase assembly protein I